MSKKLYIQLLEEDRERLLKCIREKDRLIEDLRDKDDPLRIYLREGLRGTMDAMAENMFKIVPFAGLQTIVTKEKHDEASIQPHQGSQEEQAKDQEDRQAQAESPEQER